MPWPVHPTGFFGAQGDNDTYKIERSLRFNSADSAYLNRTPASAGNRKTWTWSGWVKRGKLGTTQSLFARYTANTGAGLLSFMFWNDDTLRLVSGSTDYRITTARYRDVSSWYHLVCSVDTTNATANNRIRFYVNGSEVTSFSTTNNFNQNDDTQVNENVAHYIGYYLASVEFDGYLTEIHFIDGQALTPSSFGETDAITGRWKAKAYSGTYGTNGFYLKFADNSGTTATTLGKDSSGNGNNWTPNNFSVTAGVGNDSLLDSPTNSGDSGNYCVCNRLNSNASSITNGNLDFIGDTGSSFALGVIGTFSVSSGKWYFESTVNVVGTASFIGVIPSTFSGTANSDLEYADGAYSYRNNGDKANGTGDIFSAYGNSYTTNDVIGVAVDLDNGAIYFSKNGTWQNSGVPTSGSSKTGAAFISFSGGYSPMACGYGGASHSLNFGQRPFAYTAPSGFKALCTTNLPTPTIQKPSSYMDVVTYTGNGSTQTISSLGFSPDLVWIKSRSGAANHGLHDTARVISGDEAVLYSNTTDSESIAGSYLSSFNSNGFTLNANSSGNGNGSTYVAWAWDEAPIAGMDIVSYTGNGVARTIAHNLGVAPKMMIVKNRNKVSDWGVYHIGLTSASYYVYLQSTNAQNLATSMWNGTAPTSSVFSVESSANVNQSNDPYIAYLFAEVEGFSKFGKYSGNSSTDGPFIWCGFRPRWLMIKNITASDVYSSWLILDTQRDTYNTSVNTLWANMSSSEGVRGNGSGSGSSIPIDILSNGFKPRNSGSESNSSGSDFIFAAFAESAYKYARAR